LLWDDIYHPINLHITSLSLLLTYRFDWLHRTIDFRYNLSID
jgi:hypothetical protein